MVSIHYAGLKLRKSLQNADFPSSFFFTEYRVFQKNAEKKNAVLLHFLHSVVLIFFVPIKQF